MSTSTFLTCAAFLIATGGPRSTEAASTTPPEIESAFISLEAQVEALREVMEPNPLAVIEIQLHRAEVVWRSDPETAAALFNIVLRSGLSDARRTHILIQAARVEAMLGHSKPSLEHFLAALELSQRRDHTVAAFEGFVGVAERAVAVPGVPPINAYVDALESDGQLDPPAYETIYRLGQLLNRRGDPRAYDVMAQIPPDVPAGRRALYVRAADHLRRDQRQAAVELFEQAATLPPYSASVDLDPDRDRDVREMAWLAIGRLAFEAGDVPTGIGAYHEIPVASRHFLEAFYELGWLAMEAGQEKTARAAFAPVVELGSQSELGRQADLMRGYLLLQEGNLDGARDHYGAVAAKFSEQLVTFDRNLAKVTEITDLARECETRTWAMGNAQLRPILFRDGVEAARRMAIELEELAAVGYAIDKQLEEIDGLLAGDGDMNPFVQIERDRRAINVVTERVHELTLNLDRTAALGTTTNVPAVCCGEPRLRARRLLDRLNGFSAELQQRETNLRTEFTQMRATVTELQTDQRQLHTAISIEVRAAQHEAVTAAITQERRLLDRMAMEGRVGEMEALWRHKEITRDGILAAETTRKQLLDILLARYAELLEE